MKQVQFRPQQPEGKRRPFGKIDVKVYNGQQAKLKQTKYYMHYQLLFPIVSKPYTAKFTWSKKVNIQHN